MTRKAAPDVGVHVYLDQCRTGFTGLRGLTGFWGGSGGDLVPAVARRGAADVEMEDALHFSDRLRIALGAVVGRDDQLRPRAFEMGAPVGDDAVARVRRVAAAAIADDTVVGQAGLDGDGVDRFHEAVVGGEGVDAVGNVRDL